MSTINRNIHNTTAAVSSSNADNEMTLLMLQLRTLQQAKRSVTTVPASPSHITSTNNNSNNDNVVKQPSVSRSTQVGIGSNIPHLLQRRRQYREQEAGGGGGGTQRLLRTDLVKLMDEALSISTEITMVVPNEPAIGSNKHY